MKSGDRGPGTRVPASASLHFRAAGPEDVAAIVALTQSAYRGEASRAGWTTEADFLDGQRTDVREVAGLVANPRVRLLLAEQADRLLASCVVERLVDGDACDGYFGMFSVRPEAQGNGTGRALLAEAERVARDDWHARTMRMTVIDVRAELIAWYERRGYRRTGEYRPFPYGDPRFGIPRRDDLRFEWLVKDL
ncbi:MAG: GNAT family N-acetyltransferase [Xanthomonadales bacterium]|nr:GNAT family N-acetyltransferase [Xanthomonadales bacterium]ODU91775.1 MAG: GNAT family N-acetyltransferase [Rhodanobacter sp. SCN 66-43]OJY82705.1 MAG: GNAT family N-acetyltransferase [Xanthomonadales bacterium 66-474]